MTARISIAMATYNGAKYINDQLISIARQDCLPDELIICDDCSSDDTIKIIGEFSNNSPFNVTVISNEENLGVTRNFEKAISLCSGDIIFIADQDDVWFESKMSTMVSVMNQKRSIQIAVNDAILANLDLSVTWGSLLANTRKVMGAECEFIPGCCTVMKKEFRNLCLPIPSPDFNSNLGSIGYDAWLHLVGELLDVKSIIDVPLQYYRRHGGNVSQSNVNKKHVGMLEKIAYYKTMFFRYVENGDDHTQWLLERVYYIDFLLQRLEELDDFKDEALLLEKTKILNYKKSTLESRIHICEMPRIRRSVAAMTFYINGGYKSFRGVKSMLVDVCK